MQVLAVAFFLGQAGAIAQFDRALGGDGDDRLAEHLRRLKGQEAGVVDVPLDSARHLLHPVALFAVDLHRVDADADLTNRRVDLVDHGADDVDALQRPAQLDQTFSDDRDRDLTHGVFRIGDAGRIGIGIHVGGCYFAAELFLPGPIFGGDGGLPRLGSHGLPGPQLLHFIVRRLSLPSRRFGDGLQAGDDVRHTLDIRLELLLVLLRERLRGIDEDPVLALQLGVGISRFVRGALSASLGLLEFPLGLAGQLGGPHCFPFLGPAVVRRLVGDRPRLIGQLLMHVHRGTVVRPGVAVDNLGDAVRISVVVQPRDPGLDMIRSVKAIDERARVGVLAKLDVRARRAGDAGRRAGQLVADGFQQTHTVIRVHPVFEQIGDALGDRELELVGRKVDETQDN